MKYWYLYLWVLSLVALISLSTFLPAVDLLCHISGDGVMPAAQNYFQDGCVGVNYFLDGCEAERSIDTESDPLAILCHVPCSKPCYCYHCQWVRSCASDSEYLWSCRKDQSGARFQWVTTIIVVSMTSNGRKIGREPTGRVGGWSLRFPFPSALLITRATARLASPLPPHISRARQKRSRDQATGTHNLLPPFALSFHRSGLLLHRAAREGSGGRAGWSSWSPRTSTGAGWCRGTCATRPTRESRPRTGPTSPTPTPAAPTSTTRPGSAAPVRSLSLPSRSLVDSPSRSPPPRRRAGGRCSCWLPPLDLIARRSNQSSARWSAGRPVLAFFLGDGFSCDIGTLLLNERVLIYWFAALQIAGIRRWPRISSSWAPAPRSALLRRSLRPLFFHWLPEPSSHASSSSEQGKLLRSVSAMLPFAERDANATNLR